MAAFRRRTAFAAPLILTVATGCSPNESKQQAQPASAVTWAVRMKDMKCYAVQTGANPPPPAQAIVCPPGMSGATTMTVVQQANQSCVALPGKHLTACPLPPGKQLIQPLGVIWTIEKLGADCHAEEEDECPPGLDCNPPKPRTFPCPPGVTEDKPLHVAELPDASCVLVPEGCTDTGCATVPAPCPPPEAREH